MVEDIRVSVYYIRCLTCSIEKMSKPMLLAESKAVEDIHDCCGKPMSVYFSYEVPVMTYSKMFSRLK